MPKLTSLTIQGYKSIQNLENFGLHNLNILIGANGAGKSNFISVFKLLANVYAQNLQLYIQETGGVETFLHYGRKKTKKITLEFYFEQNAYAFSLLPTQDNRLIFENEIVHFTGDYEGYANHYYPSSGIIGSAHSEAVLKESSHKYARFIKPAIESWRVYHFHDTSDTALVKLAHPVNDNLRLKTDAANLAAFLLHLKQNFSKNYQQIVKTIQLVAPFFADFVHRKNEQTVQLEWLEVGNLDTPFKAHVLSDGTLRFICLVTLLLQSFSLMSDIIVIDEPELGLHPYALAVLADLIKRAAEKKQLIISTQSVELIDYFSVNDIIVVDRVNNATLFKRLDAAYLKDWLEDYTLGDLWKQNIIGGRPAR